MAGSCGHRNETLGATRRDTFLSLVSQQGFCSMESAHEVQTNKWTLEGVNTVSIQCILWLICGGKEGGEWLYC